MLILLISMIATVMINILMAKIKFFILDLKNKIVKYVTYKYIAIRFDF
jgi:hypothetical protein